MALARTKKHTLNTCFLSLHMCSRICKHNYRITIIVKIGYRDHSPAGLVVTGVPLARDDMHSPRATGRPLSIHPAIGRLVANYGAPVWSTNAIATSIGKIQIAQNEALRIATGSHKMSSIDHLHNETEMLTVKQHSDLLSAQYLVECLDPDHVWHNITTMDVPPRQMKHTLHWTTHQTLSNSPTDAGCYKEGNAPGCTHRGCHQGYQQPTA